MSNKLDLVKHVFSQVSENLVFMFTEDWNEDDRPLTEKTFAQAQVQFTGPFSGSLSIVAPESLCVQIKANMIGANLEEGISSKRPYDALGELLNVTCGHLLTALAGEDPVFNLTPPETMAADHARWDAVKRLPDTAALLLDDIPVLLHLEKSS
jgi:hypothetical protein